MFLNKATLRKAAGHVALLLATGSLLATGITPANAADSTPLFLSFESSDPLKNVAAAGGAFGGAAAETSASTNLTGDALKFTKGNEPWSGVNILGADSTPFRYADGTKTTITFDYWSNDATASPVLIKLEVAGASVRKAVATQPGLNKIVADMSTGAGWNAAAEYKMLIIFPNFSVDDQTYTGVGPIANTGQVYEIDNISINGGTSADIYAPVVPEVREATSTLLTFEAADTLGATAIGAGFEGASTAIVDAPAGGNGGKVLEITKSGNAWSGVNLVTAPAGVKFDKVVTLNYFSPETVNTPVQFQLLATGSTLSQAVETVPGWQKLTFDFTTGFDATKDYTKAVIFPNFVNSGDVPGYSGAAAAPMADKKFAIDNVGFNGATTPAIAVPRTATSTLLTFEADDVLGAKVVGEADAEKAEGGFEGALTTIVDAPAGGNGGKALKIVKNVGAQIYAGVNMVKFMADTRVTDGTNKKITFNYYSPKANSPVNVEVRPYPKALGKVVVAPLGWSTITVDFTDVAGWSSTEEFIGVTVFPDFNQPAGTVALAYYVDNLAFNGATTPAITVVAPKVKPSVRTAASVMGSSTKVAKTLTAGKGLWSGSSTIAYTYKWYRCSVSSTKTATTAPTSSAKCATISGATKSTYKLAKADVGKYVRVLITAKNTAGTAYSLSKTSKKVVK
jgi:hypothetical protein